MEIIAEGEKKIRLKVSMKSYSYGMIVQELTVKFKEKEKSL